MKAPSTDRDVLHKENEAGFTLPELLVTILVMGILFAIATTSWLGVTESRRVTSATNQMVADLRLAHSSASNQLAEHFVVFSATSGGKLDANCAASSSGTADYCAIKRDSSGTNTKTLRYLPDGTKIMQSSVNTTSPTDAILSVLGIGTGTKAIRFKADGSADAPSGFSTTAMTITVSSKDGNRSSVVQINQATARVKVQ